MRKWIMLVGAALTALGGTAFGAQFVLPLKTDGAWLATVLGTVATGGALLGGAKFGGVAGSAGSAGRKAVAALPAIQMLQQADLAALHHLTIRFTETLQQTTDPACQARLQQAIEMCREILGTYIFDLHYIPALAPPVPPKDNADDADGTTSVRRFADAAMTMLATTIKQHMPPDGVAPATTPAPAAAAPAPSSRG